jgi:hypothetical protein
LVQNEAHHQAAGGDRSGADGLRAPHPALLTVPFNSKNKHQEHVHEDVACGRDIVLMKGVQEHVMERCMHAVINRMVVALTPQEHADILWQ